MVCTIGNLKNDELVTTRCENCNAPYHEKELAELLQNRSTCMKCEEEFDPYYVFTLTDRYDMETEGKNVDPSGSGSKFGYYMLNGIFGLMSPKNVVISMIVIFVGISLSLLI